jgi:hypothetical protein
MEEGTELKESDLLNKVRDQQKEGKLTSAQSKIDFKKLYPTL